MVINIIGPVGPNLYYYWSAKKGQKAAEEGETDRFMTQEEMNNVFMGPEFEVSRTGHTAYATGRRLTKVKARTRGGAPKREHTALSSLSAGLACW
jgi:hypothetical protein